MAVKNIFTGETLSERLVSLDEATPFTATVTLEPWEPLFYVVDKDPGAIATIYSAPVLSIDPYTTKPSFVAIPIREIKAADVAMIRALLLGVVREDKLFVHQGFLTLIGMFRTNSLEGLVDTLIGDVLPGQYWARHYLSTIHTENTENGAAARAEMAEIASEYERLSRLFPSQQGPGEQQEERKEEESLE